MIPQIETFWGENLTKLVIPEELKPLLNSETIKFLEEVGLPNSEAMFKQRETYIANLAPDLLSNHRVIHLVGPHLFFGGQAQLVEFDQKNYILIGEPLPELGLELGIAIEPLSNEVVNLNSRAENPVTFVNSSITQCVKMVTIDFYYRQLLLPYELQNKQIGIKIGHLYKSDPDGQKELKLAYKQESETLAVEVICDLAKKLVADLKKADPKAFAEEDYFWSQYFWDIERYICPDVVEEQ